MSAGVVLMAASVGPVFALINTGRLALFLIALADPAKDTQPA